jgi:hypothetical protein
VGFGGGATAVAGQKGGPELLNSGGGFGVWLGLRSGYLFAVELGFQGSFHNPVDLTPFGDVDYLVLSAATLDGKLFLSRHPIVQPYVQFGGGIYTLGRDALGTAASGGGFQLGGGVEFALAPFLGLGARMLYRGVSMGPPDSSTNDTYVSLITGEVHLNFYLF